VAKHPDLLVGVRPNGLEDTPQFKIDIDQEKAQALGVSISDINTTLGAAWGGSYVNDFIDRGRVKKVYVMSEAHTVCCRTISTTGTFAAAMVRWYRSPPSQRHAGNTVRRVWNAITVCHRWKSWVRLRRAEVPVKR
jgi:multidrug efflux pump